MVSGLMSPTRTRRTFRRLGGCLTTICDTTVGTKDVTKVIMTNRTDFNPKCVDTSKSILTFEGPYSLRKFTLRRVLIDRSTIGVFVPSTMCRLSVLMTSTSVFRT